MKNMMDYFKSEKAFYSYVLLFGQGTDRTDALKISEDLYENKEAAKAWAKWILANTDGEKETVKEISRIYKRMTGEELPQESNEEETSEPKRFAVGEEIVVSESNAEFGPPIGRSVVKRTKCYVWTIGSKDLEPEKKRIQVDEKGNEYVVFFVSPMIGNRRYEPA